MNALIAALMLAAITNAAPEPNAVTLCTSGSRPAYMPYAEKAAVALFRNIHVPLTWADGQCSADAIKIRFEREVPATHHPGALAYAHPYEVKTIVVFPDRVEQMTNDRLFLPKLLAHVLVHEITHVLQGTARHSNTGIMKGTWTSRDYSEMAWNGMSFDPADVTLIEKGLRRSNQDEVRAMIDRVEELNPTRPALAQSFPILQGSEDAILMELVLIAAQSAYTSADPA